MTRKEVKAFLSEYRQCMAKVYRLTDEMKRLTASANCIKREIEEYKSRCELIESIINSHTDFTQREILIRRFIYGDTIEEVAEKLCYSPRHIQRLTDLAIVSLMVKVEKAA